MKNTQTLPPRPFQEAQAESSKKKEKKSVSTKSNRKNNEKKLPNLPSESLMKSGPGFLNKKKKFRLGRSLTESKTLPKTKER